MRSISAQKTGGLKAEWKWRRVWLWGCEEDVGAGPGALERVMRGRVCMRKRFSWIVPWVLLHLLLRRMSLKAS